jgi:uncharacterized phage protein gp47/JayE
VQASARQLLDLSTGSALRAVLEASASVGLWIQWLIVQVLQTTRAATSTGADLDSWVGDFSVARLPAVAASGTVTFGRSATAGTALIPAGTLVRTADAALSFAVAGDAANPAWSAAQGGYVMDAGVASIDAKAVAVAAGAAGNVQPGAIALIAAALPGVDTVTNAAAFLGGLDAESDAALRARFGGFMNSRARATAGAIGYAVQGVQQGLQYTLQENRLPDGSTSIGSFVVTVDDGSGAPSASLLAAVGAAVETMRPVGAVYAVMAPAVTEVSVSLAVALAPGADGGAVRAAVGAAITDYVAGLGLGNTLAWSKLIQVAHDASPLVSGVSALLLNGAGADIAPGPGGVVKPAGVAVG